MDRLRAIDRRRVLSRHLVRRTREELNAPLSVGNGTFCVTVDSTGLQTFYGEFAAGDGSFPLCTMAEWGWHSYPDAPKDDSSLRLESFDSGGRTVGYPTDDRGQEALFRSLRQNAHKFSLARIGFAFPRDGTYPHEPFLQTLDIHSGEIESAFTLRGAPVRVLTLVHPDEDTLCVRAESPLIRAGPLRVELEFPYGSHKKSGADFSVPDRHSTATRMTERDLLLIERRMDGTRYRATVRMGETTRAAFDAAGGTPPGGERPHSVLFSSGSDSIEICVRFEPSDGSPFAEFARPPAERSPLPSFGRAREACAAFWSGYWERGAALDLSPSADSRAFELERRIVLSQYLAAINSRGVLPPAETGLACNSWYGKFHLEMHFWHVAHFAPWGRPEELLRSLEYYRRIYGRAGELARSQGYTGVRWPKMCDPSGRNSPSTIAPLLLWQQPHPIALAELAWRATGDRDLLGRYRDAVVSSAEFMAGFLRPDGDGLSLGPPVIPAQERHDPRETANPAFETEYFRWGLNAANEWLARLGEPAVPEFAEAALRLARPATAGGAYLAHGRCPDTFERFATDHPSMLMALGVLPGEGLDRGAMSRTLDLVRERWDFTSMWGWDFPAMAMTAWKLGRREDSMDLLLADSPKNTFRSNGHNAQVGSADLPLYLPGNGALLLAVAAIAGDCASGAEGPPGFSFRGEGFKPYI